MKRAANGGKLERSGALDGTRRWVTLGLMAGLGAAPLLAVGADAPAFRDPDRPLEERLADLVSRLTLDEKIGLLSESAPAIPRLGIPPYYHGNEALHGVVRPGVATVFPQAIALASTWNPALVREVADAISDEARAKWNGGECPMRGEPGESKYCGLLTFWSPTINMARDPRWGRTEETYGEDPHLAGRLAVAFVKGLQGDDPRYLKVVSTPKHFAANNEEHNRFECNAKIPERSLREYYLPAFQAAVVEGQAQSVMSAYNAINGVPCSGNRWLLTDLLRGEWGFDGYVVTDCGAVSHMLDRHRFVRTPEEAAAAAIHAGVSLECGTWCTILDLFQKHLGRAVAQGLVSEAEVTQAAERVLRARFRLGLFDPRERVPWSRLPASVVGSAEHVALARRAARESIVLLRNAPLDGQALLPFDPERLRSVALVGPNAGLVQLGGYSGTPANEPASPLAGLRARLGDRVAFVPWVSGSAEPVPIGAGNLRPSGEGPGRGLSAQYYRSFDLSGAPYVTRTDREVDFEWTFQPPDPAVSTQVFSVRWTGSLVPTVSGEHEIVLGASGRARLWIDGALRVDAWSPRENATDTIRVRLEAGRAHALRLEYAASGALPITRLQWRQPFDPADPFRREREAARTSEAVIAVVGLGRHVEAEGRDRTSLELPPDQEAFVRELTKANPRTVVVLVNGGPLSVPWIAEHVPAVVEAWYGGEQAGAALADVLLGDASPGGRLPLTVVRGTSDLPPFDDYDVARGRTYRYFTGEPLYPFGHGLSYTRFEHRALALAAARVRDGDTVVATLEIANVGERAGDEVVQLYVSAEDRAPGSPVRALRAFERLSLRAGEARHVTLRVPVRDLARWDVERQAFVVDPGAYEVRVGASSADVRQRARLEVVRD
jgi:beta-glucosidase